MGEDSFFVLIKPKININTKKMRGKLQKIINIVQKSLIIALSFVFIIAIQVYASSTPQFSQQITAGTKSVDIVDSSGDPVTSPTVSFGSLSYSFDTQDGSGTLGVTEAKVRAFNPTSATTLTVSIGAAGTTVWDSGSNTFDYNDPDGYVDGDDTPDTVGGEMTIDANAGTLTGVSGCSTSYVSKGASASFNQETSTNSIDLITSTDNAANDFCRWDLIGVDVDQKIPAAQAAGTYTITLSLSIT
jgi:hypothetical protein